MGDASIVLKGNVIFDGTGREPFSGAVIVEGNKVAAIVEEQEADAYIGVHTKILDLKDKLIMPGLNDCHTHMSQGAFLEDEDFCFSCVDAESKDEVLRKLKNFAAAHPDNEWVIGHTLVNYNWEDNALPTRHEIDEVLPNRPVVLQLEDLHSVVTNTCAIEKAGFTDETPNPPDGVIEKDENGNMTGVFINGAGFAFLEAIYNVDDNLYLDIYRKFTKKLNKLGVTTASLVHPFGVYKDPIKFYEQLEQEGSLTTRVCFYPNLADYDKKTYDALYQKYDGEKIRLRGLKQLIDGVTSNHTAYMLEPYTNDLESCGCTALNLDVFKEQMMKVIADNRAVRIHTIGDKALRTALDYFEEAKEKYGDQKLRHVQEHIECAHPDDIERFGQLGVSCGIMPIHMLLDFGNNDKQDNIGLERCKFSWPMRTLLDTGAIIGIGSDFPAGEIDPMKTIYGSVTRKGVNGHPETGWFPEQKISLAETLKAYTYGSAYVEGCEEDFGTLEPGKFADIIILDRNPFEIDVKDILNTQVEITIFDGKIVYEKQRN